MSRARRAEDADTTDCGRVDGGQGGETVELLRADEKRYLAHDPANDRAWITSALVVANRR